jgi:hypothetical protein
MRIHTLTCDITLTRHFSLVIENDLQSSYAMYMHVGQEINFTPSAVMNMNIKMKSLISFLLIFQLVIPRE